MAPAPALPSPRAIAGADVRIVASGHRHRHHRDGRAVWAPSLTLAGGDEAPAGSIPVRGCLEHRLAPGGGTSPRARAALAGQLREHDVRTTALKMPWASIVGPIRRSR